MRRPRGEYTVSLWNKRVLEAPTSEDALVIARALRIEGDREARKLAEQIEKPCRAALWYIVSVKHNLLNRARFSATDKRR